jgi:putative hydrolase of HD superfamily
MQKQLIQSLELLTIAEKLKCELRHSWLSNGKQESVAEHSWRLALMVCLFAPYITQAINIEKTLKMALVHDLAEAETGDIPMFNCADAASKQQKFLNEQKAMLKIKSLLDNDVGQEIYDLWLEYEEKQSYEAKFVNALDKIEAHIQHGEADISIWQHHEKLMVFQTQWLDKHCEFDTTMVLLKDLVKQTIYDKFAAHGEDLDRLREEAKDANIAQMATS